MMKLSNVSLLGSVLMAAAAETGSNKPAKSAAKGKADTSKTKGNAKAPAVKADAPKTGGRNRLPIFSDKAKIVEALGFIHSGNMDGFAKAGFSQHHIRQLGKGVSGGMFGPGAGLGYVEMVADQSPRADGSKGRRPLVPALTKEGSKFLKTEEMKAARKAGETPAPKSEKSAPKTGNKPKAPKVEAKTETAPEAPAVEAQPQVETAPVTDAGNSESVAA